MDPRVESIGRHTGTIERILDEWGFAERNSPNRAAKQADVLFWLENFRPSEIDDAVLLLSKLQYKSEHVVRQSIDALSRELTRVLGDRLDEARFFQLGLSPSDSGGLYLYDYRKALSLQDANFPQAPFSDYVSTASAVIFFDDIIGTGSQASRFFRENLRGVRVPLFYVALFGFDDGVAHVRRETSFTNVIVGVQLSDEERAFTPTTRVFPDVNERERIRALASRYGQVLYPRHPLGYDDSQALLVFPHTTPNNTLPLIWAGPENEKEPGVVWNPVWRRRKPRRTSNTPNDAVRRYLDEIKKEFAVWQHRYVHLTGREQIVEVPLYALETVWEATDAPRRQGQIRALLAAVSDRHVVLAGDAGMGKTTTLQFLAHDQAEDAITGSNTQVPIYVPLRRVTGEISLERLLFEETGLPAALVEERLIGGSVTLYLDGVNEIPAGARQRVVPEIAALFRKYPATRFIIASRAPLTRRELGSSTTFILEKLTPEQIRHFLDRNASTPATADLVWKRVEENLALRRLVATPLLLLMLLNVAERTGAVPASEAEIIKHFVDGLFEREQGNDHEFDAVETRLLMRQFAFVVREEADANVALPIERSLEVLTGITTRFGLRLHPLGFLRKAAELGLLVEEHGRYAFTHQIYQDYFAAEAIANQTGNRG
ncbi:MAG TPA: NACHT domain-containing protein [Thermoanaerobaculia bacterium]|nr:NACHT domain-containing protein [Thermoanaerobaculia bacterium]